MKFDDDNAIACDQTADVEVQSAAHNIGHPGTSIQQSFDVAVVIPTILRPSLRRALESIFTQDLDGRIQILIGIDQSDAPREIITDICRSLPQNCFVTVMDIGYSTSVRYGGLHLAKDGGAMRTVLSYLANSRYVAYLDDDNWWDTAHLSSLMNAIKDVDWASSLRWFVDKDTSHRLCVDIWESTGVETGFFQKRFGGWVDPNCLMIDKIKCEPVLRYWSIPLKGDKKGMSSDRNVFHALRTQFRHQATGKPTCYYAMNPEDGLHSKRMNWIRKFTENIPQHYKTRNISSDQDPININQVLHSAAQYQSSGRLRKAKSVYKNILENDPYHPIALFNLALVEQKIGNKNEAVELFSRALIFNPNHAEAYNSLGVVLQELGELDKAVKSYRKALDIKSDYAVAYCNLGAALKELGKLDDAVTSYQKALRINPDYAGAYYNLGNTLRRLGKPDEAVESYRKALELKPNDAKAHTSLGFSLQALGELDTAIESHKKALQLKPNYALAHLNHSLALLSLGNFEDGWKEYEWRWKTTLAKKPAHEFQKYLWDGKSLNGKTILLFAEQGLGDTIQFVRYVEEVSKFNGNIIVECQRPLFRLLSNIPEIDHLVVSGDPLPEYDVCAPLLSLPYIMGTTATSIPENIPYLCPDNDGLYLNNLKKENKNVGIAWAGSLTHNNDKARSIQLSNFIPLASIVGVQLFSLQVGDRRSDLQNIFDDVTIVDAAKDIKDFDDTAKIIDQLDLIISVDTAVAHLAGAMGKPVWMLLPFAPDFRWLLDRDDTPWYPTMRLFRQKKRGVWSDVFHKIMTLLAESENKKKIEVSFD